MSTEKNVPTMSIDRAVNYIIGNCHLQLTQPEMGIPYVKGPPGIGKTKFIQSEAKKRGFDEVLSFHLSLIPLEDLSGIPEIVPITNKYILENSDNKNINGTRWTLPDIMTQIYDASEKNEKVIVFLDDFHIASPGHVALCFELFSDRKFRGFGVPENVAFIVAGNDSSKSGDKKMFGAVINRFAIFNVYPDFDYWVSRFAIPNGINKKIVTFLKAQINRRFFLEEEDTMAPWASPRSWTRLSYKLNELEKHDNNISMEVIQYLSYAHVGAVASSEFTTYYSIYSKTEMDKVFDRQKKIVIPEDNQDCYIYGMAAANEYTNRIIRHKEKKEKMTDTINILYQIIVEISKYNIEIGVALLSTLTDYNKTIGTNLELRKVLNELNNKHKDISNRISKSLTDIVTNMS